MRRSPTRARPGAVVAAAVVAAAVGGATLLAAAPAPAEAPAGQRAPSGDTLRVLVYNVHAGTDADGRPKLDAVASLIRDAGADVVLLQEVDRGTERSGGVDQLARLADATGLRGAFGRTLDFQGGGYGIALLSRWPIRADTLIRLPVDPVQERAGGSHEPRGALRATLEAPGGPVRVVNTHLDASPDDHYRRQEVETVLAAAGAPGAGAGLTLVGGDFNDRPRSATVDRMRSAGWTDAWRACGRGEGETYPAREPDRRIDYLFLSEEARCLEARVLESRASDHRPLLVRVLRTGRATGRSPGSGPGRDAGGGGAPSP